MIEPKTIYDLQKIRDWKKRMRIALQWFPRMRTFFRNIFPEIFEENDG